MKYLTIKKALEKSKVYRWERIANIIEDIIRVGDLSYLLFVSFVRLSLLTHTRKSAVL